MMTERNHDTYGISPDMLKSALNEDFTKLLDNTFAQQETLAGQVVKGIIVRLEGDIAVVDIGMKAEGRISLKEFLDPGKPEVTISEGDTIDVFVESLDDTNGEAQLSREKARREASLDLLEKAFASAERVKGIIFGRVKGGFMVDVQGALAFLPGSQVDIRPVRDMNPLMHTELEFQILKMDRKRGNIIVSRRSILDESRAEARDELLKDMHEGKVVDGVVKNITDYGAFIDMGGVDGLLHITDIAWHRINHPSEVLSIGQNIKVQVIRFNEDTKRVSLGLKQLQQDPWNGVEEKFPVGARVKGTITNITDYGAFVELAPGVEGLIHVSEMSWTRKNVHPGKIVSTSQEVDVMVLEIDRDKRRISLGLKQCQSNPWESFLTTYPEGSIVEGVVRNVTDFGVFIGLNEEIDGLVHMSDISWDKAGEEALAEFKKGDTVKAKVLSIDADKERVSLGIKQLSEDPAAGLRGSFRKNDVAEATVTAITDEGLDVELKDGSKGHIQARDLGRGRDAQDPHKYTVGSTVRAAVLKIDAKKGLVSLSIKALDAAEEKEAVKEYMGETKGSASLGDVLGEALASTAKAAKPAKSTAKKSKAE